MDEPTIAMIQAGILNIAEAAQRNLRKAIVLLTENGHLEKDELGEITRKEIALSEGIEALKEELEALKKEVKNMATTGRYFYTPAVAGKVSRRVSLMTRIRRKLRKTANPDLYPVTGYFPPVYPTKR